MDVPTQCPVCGAFSLTQDGQYSMLLGVCDILTINALEKLGNYIVRAERSRYSVIGATPRYLAHTLPIGVPLEKKWKADDAMVDKVLHSAWNVVPRVVNIYGVADVTPGQITKVLDSYVHDLAVTHTAHDLYDEENGLAYRLRAIGLPVYLHQPREPVR